MIREIKVTSFVVNLSVTSMAKFIAINLIDGTVQLYETLTGIIWRTERLVGNHKGIAIRTSDFMFEVSREANEHKLITFVKDQKQKLLNDFAEARGVGENKSELSSKHSQSKPKGKRSSNMHIVYEADPDEESDIRKRSRTILKVDESNYKKSN